MYCIFLRVSLIVTDPRLGTCDDDPFQTVLPGISGNHIQEITLVRCQIKAHKAYTKI